MYDFIYSFYQVNITILQIKLTVLEIQPNQVSKLAYQNNVLA